MRAFAWNGEKIAKPGAYVGLPIDVYHGDPVVGRFVTAGSLSRASRSLAHFWAYCQWNPQHEPPDIDVDALRFGKAAHLLAFEPELFDRQFAVCPYGDDYRPRDAKQWKAELSPTLMPLRPREHITLLRMSDALRKDPEARALFAHGLPEMSFVAKDEATGIWMLTRPDFTPASAGRGLADYKTSADGAWEAFGRAAFSYDYDLQVGLALDVVAASTGEMRPTMWFVVQEKEPPFCVSIHRWEADQILYGRRRVRELLDRIAFAIESGEWPGYGAAQSLHTPFYVRRKIEEQEQAV
jgi:hypothetical protein